MSKEKSRVSHLKKNKKISKLPKSDDKSENIVLDTRKNAKNKLNNKVKAQKPSLFAEFAE